MPDISSPGLGSGLDVQGIVGRLVAAEGQPATLRLDRKEARYQAELSALGAFKSALSSFQGTLSSLTAVASFRPRTASSSDTDLLTVSATGDAAEATYSVSVEQLAQAQKLASAAFADTTSSVTGGNGGTLTFRFGTYSGGTFTVNPERATATVTISAANSSLQGIRDAVNEADIGVTASIINDGTGNRLVFVSNYSGAANGLEITVSDDDGNDTDNAGLSQFAYDPAATAGSGKNLTETVAAQDARAVIDGLTVTSSSNTLDKAIEGVTLSLVKASPGTSVTVTVSQNTAGVVSAVEGFVNGYNDFIQTVTDLTRYDPETGESGTLIGDSLVRSIKGRVQGILVQQVSGLDGKYRSLADLGIRTQSDGTLSIDSSKLTSALDEDPDAVARVFAASAVASDTLVKPAQPGTDVRPGTYALNVTALPARGFYNGAGVLPADFNTNPLVIDGNNDNFTIKVDGVQSGTIALTQGSYDSGTALAAEIQARVNGDQALRDAGVSVTVTYDSANARFVVTSDRWGSASTVEFVSVDPNTAATLGFSAGAGTAGVDVAGSLGAAAGSGSGRTLSGAGDAEGIEVDVLGGATGARGTVNVTVGIAAQLDELLDAYLGSDSPLDSRTDSLNDYIADIGEEREKLSERLDRLEQRLLAQFTALDTLLAQLQSTSTYLAQQLGSLPGARQTGGTR